MRKSKALPKIKAVFLFILTGSLLVFFISFIIFSKSAHEVASMSSLLTKSADKSNVNDKMSIKNNGLCFFEGWCGTHIRSPLFPFIKLKKIIEVGISCGNEDSLDSKLPKYEERVLLTDSLWNQYWTLDRGCRTAGEPYSDTFYGPFKINPRMKGNISDNPCENDKKVIFFKMEDATTYPEIACGYLPRLEDPFYAIDGNSLAKLKKIKYLYLANSLQERLPSQIGELTELEEIYLNYNNLTALPEEMINLKKLKLVDLTGNMVSLNEQKKIKIMLPWVKVVFDKQRNSDGNSVQFEN